MENVQGILTMDKGKVVQEILKIFRNELFNVLDPIILSSEHYGVPQKRKRVIIVGYKKDKIRFKKDPLFSYKIPSLPDPINVEESIYSLPPLGIDDGAIKLESEIKNTSPYDLYMSKEIEFEAFYEMCFSREKKNLPPQRELFI